MFVFSKINCVFLESTFFVVWTWLVRFGLYPHSQGNVISRRKNKFRKERRDKNKKHYNKTNNNKTKIKIYNKQKETTKNRTNIQTNKQTTKQNKQNQNKKLTKQQTLKNNKNTKNTSTSFLEIMCFFSGNALFFLESTFFFLEITCSFWTLLFLFGLYPHPPGRVISVKIR